MAFTPYEETFKVPSQDVDSEGYLKFRMLVGYMQEAAAKHAVELGLGYDYLSEKGLAWVLAHMSLSLYRMPTLGGEVLVRTWPSSSNKYYAFRRFEVFDGAGKTVCEAMSTWVLIDVEKRRMKAMSQEVLDLRAKGYEPEGVVDANPKKIRTLDSHEHEMELTARRDDLDYNGHVNNAVLMSWLMEAIPDEVWNSMRLKSAEISFRAECLHREKVSSRCSEVPDEDGASFLHTIVRQGDDKEFIRAESSFVYKV